MYPGEDLTEQVAHMLPKDGNTYNVRRSYSDGRTLFMEIRVRGGYRIKEGIWHLLTATSPSPQRLRQRHINRTVKVLRQKAEL